MNDGPIDSVPERSWASTCQNCGTPLTGHFCSRCGQRAIPPRPTIRELAGDAWDELVGWDGKLLRTLRTLVRHPGALTRAAIEGRRARYISPVRLYLICSVLYFLAAAAVPLPDAELSLDTGVIAGAPDATGAAIDKAIRQGLDALSADERAAVEAQIASQPAVFRPLFRRAVEDYRGLQRQVGDIFSRALFVLVPMLALQSIAEYTRSLPVIGTASIVAVLVIVAHAIAAQRNIYGDSWPKTVAKAVSVAAVYGVLWSATSFGVALFVARG